MSCRRNHRFISLLLTAAYLLGVVGSVSHSHVRDPGHAQDHLHYHLALMSAGEHCAPHAGGVPATVDAEDTCCVKVPTTVAPCVPPVFRDKPASPDSLSCDTPSPLFKVSPCSRITFPGETLSASPWVTRLRTVVLLV